MLKYFILNTLLYLSLLKLGYVSSYLCDENEVNHKNWCYKLSKINLANQLEACNSLGNGSKYLGCLKDLTKRIFQVYTNNFYIKSPYEFTVLSLNDKNNLNDLIWPKLIDRYLKENKLNSQNKASLNIFFNYYTHDYHVYIRNQPKNDEIPNLMIYPDAADLKNLSQVCIIGQQVQSNNESFMFKYSECNKNYPFICVKPINIHKQSSRIEIDRCSSLKESFPGGNWIECDKLINIFDDSSNGLFSTISESQKCCMYNINLNENFSNANSFCSRFDSQVFSSKIIGYKSILEYYASYLNTNYGKSNKLEYLNFWTSCKTNDITSNENSTCIEDSDSKITEKYEFSLAVNNGLEIVSLNITLPNAERNKTKEALSYETVRFNLSRVFQLLNQFSANDGFLITPELKLFIESSSKQFIYDELCESLINKPSNLSEDGASIKCLIKLFDFIINDSVFLIRKNLKYDHLKLNMVRTRKFNESNLARNECFDYFEENDRLAHLSLPFLNKCYHLTLFRLNSTSMDAKTLDSLNKKLVYFPFMLNSSQHNVDLPLTEIKLQVLYSILDMAGITEIKCEPELNQNLTLKILSVKSLTNANKFNSCLVNSYIYLSITGLNRFNKKNNVWMQNLTSFLNSPHSIMLSLHSYSLLEKTLQLNCYDSLSELKNEVEKCLRFYGGNYCVFTCPANCSSEKYEWVVWEYGNGSYLAQSNICQAELHANGFANKFSGTHLKNVLFMASMSEKFEKVNENGVSKNNITANTWPPAGLDGSSLQLRDKDLFYFRRNLNFKNVEQAESGSFDYLMLVKAVHLVQKKKPIELNFKLYVYNNIKNSSVNMSDLKFYMKRLIPDNDNHMIYKQVSKLKNRTVFSLTNELYLFDFSLNLELIKLFNNYFELFAYLNDAKQAESLKYPLNFMSSASSTPNKHVARLSQNETDSIYLANNSEHKIDCKWNLMNLNLGIACSDGLKLKHTNMSKQNFIVYPVESAKSNMKAFARVIFLESQTSNICEHAGSENPKNKSECRCLPGFSGSKCENVCQKGYFGRNCEIKCPEPGCNGYLICSQDPIGCLCAAGFKGYTCNETCASDEWGPECKFKCDHCPTKKCDSSSGECICANNTKGKYCDECMDGFHGDDCSKKSLKVCPKGYWSEFECNKKCGQCKSGICHIKTGACSSNACDDVRYFGRNCEIKCPEEGCNSYLICSQDPSDCLCAAGFKGYNCNESCSSNEWGEGCRSKCDHCLDNKCDSSSGECICDNKALKNCFKVCPRGYWGELECNKKCGQCKGVACDIKTGVCSSNECDDGRIEEPFCDKCLSLYTNYPKCDRKIEIKVKSNKKNESNQVEHALMVTLTLILGISLAVNYFFSKKRQYPKRFTNLEFNPVLPTKGLKNSSG